jgi:hypothetical protein
MMGLSVDDIITKLPSKTIPSIQGEPDYASINNMVQSLYSNAATLAMPLGSGQHRHIGLIMTPVLYVTLSNTSYNNPGDPGTIQRLTNAATAAQCETQCIQHAEAR